jgi:hypothetical protein
MLFFLFNLPHCFVSAFGFGRSVRIGVFAVLFDATFDDVELRVVVVACGLRGVVPWAEVAVATFAEAVCGMLRLD